MGNPCTKWILFGCISRNWAVMIFNYYSIKYMNFYHEATVYALINCITLTIGGFGGNLMSGYVADKYEAVNYRAKSFVATGACLINIPICLLLFLT